jgi:hypothetical protein
MMFYCSAHYPEDEMTGQWLAHEPEAAPRSRKTIRRALILALLAAACAPAAPVDDRGLAVCREVPDIARELTAISGLELRRPVPCDFMSKEKVNEFLKQKVKHGSTKEEIRADELTLKKFGLVPQDFDLSSSTVDLLTEQAAAFYDYDRKKLFITETASREDEEPVLAHELAHALADQKFDLGKFMRKGRNSDDGSAARLAVMEGQATWLMSEYMARKSGRSLADSPDLVRAMSGVSDSGGQFPVFESEPLYLRLTLVFPYTKGMLFQNSVFQRDGKDGFAEVFKRSPVSTAQILHPDLYFDDVKPADPDLPEPHLPHGYKGLVGGSLGELDTSVLLEQYLGKERAAEIAPHWRGSAFELRENKKAKRVVLLYAAEWDSEESAGLYLKAYREVLAKKWKHMTVASESDSAVSGDGDDGGFELRRTGKIVTSIEGREPAIH